MRPWNNWPSDEVNVQIIPYQNEAVAWNAFLAKSRNGTFLFHRDYMDYHADRFHDVSLWIKQEDHTLAMLPLNQHEDKVISHGGLTFGGLILGDKTGVSDVVALFEQLRSYWHAKGIAKLIYKPVPHIYHRLPSEEDLYALHRLGARPSRVDVSTTIDYRHRLAFSKGRKHALGKARKAGVTLTRSEDYAAFWAMLSDNLKHRHDAKPTHTLAEITLLASRFSNIQLYLAYLDEQPVAGTVIYDYGSVAHTQYIGLTEVARETGALDYLLAHLIEHVFADHAYFNFGISTCNNGLYFNEGLAAQKEMFGGRTTILQWLELEIT